MDNERNNTNESSLRRAVEARRRSGELAHVPREGDAKLPPAPPRIPDREYEVEADELKFTPTPRRVDAGRSERAEPFGRTERDTSERTRVRERSERRSAGDEDKLDTSAATEARGISHEERRRRQLRRDAVRMLFVVFTLAALILLAFGFYKLTTVRSIGITGTDKYGEAQLISLANLSTGKSLFGYDANEIAERIDSVGGIRAVSVKKLFPSRIEIVVEDVSACAFIPSTSGRYALIGSDGYVLAFEDRRPDGLIEVRGLTGYGFALSSCIDRQNRNLRTVGTVRLLNAIQKSSLAGSVLAFDLANSAYVTIELASSYTVVLGSVSEAPGCVELAAEAYRRFLPVYPNGGTIHVFSGSTVVDFTPNEP